jgi:uncharacterized membrane protein
MQRAVVRPLLFLILGTAISLAQTSTGSAQPSPRGSTDSAPKPPDLVCFGNSPDWSIQFTANGARYIAMNEPDRVFIGSFHWVPAMNAWSWNPTDLGQKEPLTAVIKKASCVDNVRKWTVPYSAQVNLPHGDMASGCCRRLKPGEAPVGPGGYSPPPSPQQ